jgi:hypothetical protein
LLPLAFTSSIPTTCPHDDSDQVAKLNFDPPPEETTEHPLPVFNYPEAAPIFFDQRCQGDWIKVSLQYERLAKPGERPLIKVKIKTFGRRRVAAVRLRIIAHDNIVVDVQPRPLSLEQKVVTTKAHEEKRRWKVGAGIQEIVRLMLKGGGKTNSSTESGTSTATITGSRMHTFTDNDTAGWDLDEAKTSHGGNGIKGFDDSLRFSLLEMPHRFSFDSWVTFVDSEGCEQTHHKTSSGFWRKYKFQ